MRTSRCLLLTAVVLASTAAFAWAQVPARVPRIGVLGLEYPSPMHGFRQGLRELGYVEGQTVILEPRFTYGDDRKLPDLANQLIRLQVNVIFTRSTPALYAAMAATKKVPIIMTSLGDPVASGLVSSAERPAGNVTGVSGLTAGLGGKWLELMRETVPEVRRVAVLWIPTTGGPPLGPSLPVPARLINESAELQSIPAWNELQTVARLLRIDLRPVTVRTDLRAALRSATSWRADAFIGLPNLVLSQNLVALAELARESRLPGIYWRSDFAEAGGLMAYGPNIDEVERRSAYFVDRILKGARPSELPMEPTKHFDLVINLETSQMLGITIPPPMLVWAARVIR